VTRGLGQHRLGSGAVTDISRPGAGRVVLFVTEVFDHLLVQRGLDDRLGELFEQPIRARQRQAPFLGKPDQPDRGPLLSGLLRCLLLLHIIQCRCHHGTFPAGLTPGASGQKHRLLHSPTSTVSGVGVSGAGAGGGGPAATWCIT